MEVSEEIKKDIVKALKEGKAIVECREIEGQPGTMECIGKIVNDDGKTYQEGSVIIRIAESSGGKLTLSLLPSKGNAKVHYLIKEHLKNIYSDADIIEE